MNRSSNSESSSEESEYDSDSSFERGFISSSSSDTSSSDNVCESSFINDDTCSVSASNNSENSILSSLNYFKGERKFNLAKYANQNKTAHNENVKLSNKTCSICQEIFPSKIALDVHKLNHFTTEAYFCEICGCTCKNKEDYAIHFQSHDQSNAVINDGLQKGRNSFFHCESCKKSFRFLSSYRRHIMKHKNLYTCNICRATFTSQLLCHQHKLKHAKKKTNNCSECGKTFQRPHQLTLHMQVHQYSGEDYRCNECDKSYGYKTSLMRHMLKYHSPTSPKFQCDVCGELFKTRQMLTCHVILHTTKKLINCPQCSQTFKYRSSYHKHLNLHQSSKPFRCSQCGKKFQNEQLLKDHKTLHIANDKYVCKLCDKSFALESFLKSHILLHKSDECK